MKTALVYSDAWRRFDYGAEHPLRMERLGLTWRLLQAYGLTTLPDAGVHAPEPASESAIAAFHAPAYLDVLRAANGGVEPKGAARWGLGPGDNPVFPGLWDAARAAAGGSLLAAELVASGAATRAFHFAGGLHHAMRDRASGFCYVNDAVLAILHLRARGLRVLYVDIDAHHGDGVQAAFYDEPAVLTISTHERGDYLFPGTGFVEETGTGAAVGYAVNLPLEPFTDSEVYLPAFEAVVPSLAGAFKPDVVVAQLGIDAHRTDPLTHLELDVQGFARAVRHIVALAPRLVALGGGGYDLQNVARGWTAAWAAMNGVELPAALPASFAEDARRHEFRVGTLWDEPAPQPPHRRLRAEDYARRQVDAIRRLIFPTHGL
ncbi:MAG TPA: acetoin utilization protein AcuC [Candidatus Rokubacteria bacterium]|nr:acetoin utilization protein AcuC [Candidatus Rokubacteria bacterium]